jgi:hypothetical protein
MHSPPPDLASFGQVSPGHDETGNLCYQIASKDAATLLLGASSFASSFGGAPQTVWFALRW